MQPQNSRRQNDGMKKFHTGGPQALGNTVGNFVARATWSLGFVHY